MKHLVQDPTMISFKAALYLLLLLVSFSFSVVQEQLLADVLQNRCSQNCSKIQRKTPVPQALPQVFSCEFCENFKSINFTKHRQFTACKNSTVITVGVLERSSQSKMFYKIQRKSPALKSLFNKAASFQSGNIIKERIQYSRVLMIYSNFLIQSNLYTAATFGITKT